MIPTVCQSENVVYVLCMIEGRVLGWVKKSKSVKYHKPNITINILTLGGSAFRHEKSQIISVCINWT